MPVPSRMHAQALALAVLLAATLAMPGVRTRRPPRGARQATDGLGGGSGSREPRSGDSRRIPDARPRRRSHCRSRSTWRRCCRRKASRTPPKAAAQALAVAIRTYALFNAGRHQRDGFDLCDTTHCQVLRASSAASRRAAQATAGLVLSYQGAPADLYYSASCGGHTERGGRRLAEGVAAVSRGGRRRRPRRRRALDDRAVARRDPRCAGARRRERAPPRGRGRRDRAPRRAASGASGCRGSSPRR